LTISRDRNVFRTLFSMILINRPFH
jgi:hypothetical protein